MNMGHNAMIAIIAAHRDGKQIEARHHGESHWFSTHKPPHWNFHEFEYRIKPEPPKPREFCLSISDSGYVAGGHPITGNDRLHYGKNYIHVREVLP
jgi:hypothetical protein